MRWGVWLAGGRRAVEGVSGRPELAPGRLINGLMVQEGR